MGRLRDEIEERFFERRAESNRQSQESHAQHARAYQKKVEIAERDRAMKGSSPGREKIVS